VSTNCRTQIRSETADSCRPDPIAGLTAAQRSIDLALRRRSLILQAQGLLAEITGCTLGRADAAITRAAQALHLDAVEVAGCLIDSVDGGLNDGSEKLLIRLIQAAGLLRTETAIGPSADLAEICYLGEIPGVRMRGELDLATVDQFLNVATKVTAMRDRATIFYLDLEYMSFIDATGLYVLSASCDQAAKRGDDVLVATPTAATSRRVLKIAVDEGPPPH
jgi:anti-anti-sigma factor